MIKHDNMTLFLFLLFGAFTVLLFVGASELDAYGQAAQGVSDKAVKCVETDDGANFFLRGTTYMSNNNRKDLFQDFCRAYDSPTLVEYYCDNGKILSQDNLCSYGCMGGVCNAGCTSGQIIGDLNNDGFVDDTDRQLMRGLISNGIILENMCCADIDNNGQIASGDYLWISAIINGNRESPGRC